VGYASETWNHIPHASQTGSTRRINQVFVGVHKMSFTDNTTGKFEWGTPQRFFDELNLEFQFTIDVCASKELAKCSKYYDKEIDGLKQDWTGETVWMNPPYGAAIGTWLKKAATSHATVVCLVPSRTDNKWWHQWVMTADEIRFVKGRLRFQGAGDGAKFPSAIVIFRRLIK
jgi:site-specific DNA-methyltransferase (adenine-specific)